VLQPAFERALVAQAQACATKAANSHKANTRHSERSEESLFGARQWARKSKRAADFSAALFFTLKIFLFASTDRDLPESVRLE
jgi:hypothetical protein